MRVTIVKEDSLVIIDNYPIRFDLTPFNLSRNFWALQWYGEEGETEYLDHNQKIDDLTPYQPIIDEYNRLKEALENQPEPKPHPEPRPEAESKPETDPGLDKET